MNECEFSYCRTYRYTLKHVWDGSLGTVVFIGLNPSTADENKLDPTLRRIRGFACDWGYGSFVMLNAFAFRATDPREMKKADDPIGPKNDEFIRSVCSSNDLTIACWGNHGEFMSRWKTVVSIVDKTMCLKLTKSGQPSHPLYLKKSLKPIFWRKR